MFSFGRSRTPTIGIDISSSSIKVMEFAQTSGGYRIEHYAIEPLPQNAVNEKTIADVDTVGETIRKAVKRSGSRAKHCSMAVAGSAVITKVITMPASLNDEDLEAQIQLEADQYIPYALEEVNLDFDVQGLSEGNPETVDVLLTASRSENVDIRINAAEIAGLTPKVMDVEAYAVENVYPLLLDGSQDTGTGHSVAVFDIGATMTSLNVMRDNKMIYTREQPFGGRQLTEEIMSVYGLTMDEAGRQKKDGSLPMNYTADLLNPFKETMAQQVNRFLQFYYSASQQSKVDHIILAGGCSAIPGIDELIESQLHISTSIANPFSHLALGSKVNPQVLAEDAPCMMIACGLALRSFD